MRERYKVPTLHTVYGLKQPKVKQLFKTDKHLFDIPRPIGMNDLLDIGRKRPHTINSLDKLEPIAKARGYVIMIAYADDTAYCITRVGD